MYRHHTLRTNYTTYDVLRHQDTINPSTHHCFALLPAEFELDSDEHPYIYAKILGVYHAKVNYKGGLPQRFDFVHVRWLYYDYERPGGWGSCKLDRLSYTKCQTEQDITDSFDFIDPKDIIRAAHIIPDFHSGISDNFLRSHHSISHDNPDHTDWEGYYVNRYRYNALASHIYNANTLKNSFVDRDMLMRYIGKGVGHFKQEIGQTGEGEGEGEGEGVGEGEGEGEGEGAGDDEGAGGGEGGDEGKGDGEGEGEVEGEGEGRDNDTDGSDIGGIESDPDENTDLDGSVTYESDSTLR